MAFLSVVFLGRVHAALPHSCEPGRHLLSNGSLLLLHVQMPFYGCSDVYLSLGLVLGLVLGLGLS